MLVEREEACFHNSGVALYFEQNQTPNRRLKHANVPRGAEQYTPPQKLQGEPQTSGPHRNRDECLTRTRPQDITRYHKVPPLPHMAAAAACRGRTPALLAAAHP